jgi:hypothetical protein
LGIDLQHPLEGGKLMIGDKITVAPNVEARPAAAGGAAV